jgi:hypothetical protein
MMMRWPVVMRCACGDCSAFREHCFSLGEEIYDLAGHRPFIYRARLLAPDGWCGRIIKFSVRANASQ